MIKIICGVLLMIAFHTNKLNPQKQKRSKDHKRKNHNVLTERNNMKDFIITCAWILIFTLLYLGIGGMCKILSNDKFWDDGDDD